MIEAILCLREYIEHLSNQCYSRAFLTLEKTIAAGKILVSFNIALLTYDIIGLILSLMKNKLNEWPCKIVALILHIFSLLLCIWLCIITYDLHSIFQFENIKHESTMLYLRYSIIAWGLPFLVIAICLSLNTLFYAP